MKATWRPLEPELGDQGASHRLDHPGLARDPGVGVLEVVAERAGVQLLLEVLPGRGVARRLPDVDVEVAVDLPDQLGQRLEVGRRRQAEVAAYLLHEPAAARGVVAGVPRHLEAVRCRQVEDVLFARHLHEHLAGEAWLHVLQDARERGYGGLVADQQQVRAVDRVELGAAVRTEPVRGDHLDHVARLGRERPAARRPLAVPGIVVDDEVDDQPDVVAVADDVADRVGAHRRRAPRRERPARPGSTPRAPRGSWAARRWGRAGSP